MAGRFGADYMRRASPVIARLTRVTNIFSRQLMDPVASKLDQVFF